MFRIRFKKLGGHVHFRLFAGPHEFALGKCGNLCMREEEFKKFRDATPFISYIEDDRAKEIPNPLQVPHD